MTLALAVIVSLTLVGGALAGSSPTPGGGSSLPGPHSVGEWVQETGDGANEQADEVAQAANETAGEGQDVADGLVSEGENHADEVIATFDDLVHTFFDQMPRCHDFPANQLLPLNRYCSDDPGGQGGPGPDGPDDDDDENTTTPKRLWDEVDSRVTDANKAAGDTATEAENATFDLLRSVWGPLQGAGQQAGRLLHDVMGQAEHAADAAIHEAEQAAHMALFLVGQAQRTADETIGGVFNTIQGILSPASAPDEEDAQESRYPLQSASVAVPSASNLVLGMIVASGVGLALVGMAGLRRLLGLGGITLLSRIPANQIMKNGSRQTIHDIVASDPGVSLNEIVERVGLSRNAVAYHLAVFESEKVMSSVKDGKYRRYFINGGAYVNGAKNVVAAIKNEKTLDVIRYITEHPGVIQKDVCSAVGTSPSATSWHIRRLEKVGLVEKQREANMVRYNPGPNLSRYDLSAFGLQTTGAHQQHPVPAPS